MKIAVAAGGTAGHAVPALAVADALKERGAEVIFFGGERAEAELVPAAGYEFNQLTLAGLDRRNPLKALRAVWLAFRGVFTARKQLRAKGVVAVLAGGGYVAGPVGAAAVTLRLPLIVTEADAHLGIANKLLAPFARRVCLAFDLDSHNDEKYLVTGRPIALRHAGLTKPAAREKFGLPSEGRCLLVFGGSLGARNINRALLDAFEDGLPEGLMVLHLTGRGDHAAAKEILDSRPALAEAANAGRYRLLDFTSDFDLALEAADVSVCRAGGSIFELAAAGLPAILVPYPHATADHQALNAKWLTDGDAAVMVRDHDLNGTRLRELLDPMLADPARLEAMSQNALRLAMPDAADRIASELITAAEQA
ncbi:MAG: UDP-N-acetylglucosamine--N-acetylmuramyl-(pentapeptide) pyrophosphoryl-undecaprenol N-acetylglucosamine transferase [Solirubrobacterales bacterium]|nr:UDP-N-acetylglucosamine--N-acetylmuramyl-(pentapeptide) pyrophosphoryl-undecaprenol N-acetylglucosamine transferase [Solirubrobacterales bacterium]